MTHFYCGTCFVAVIWNQTCNIAWCSCIFKDIEQLSVRWQNKISQALFLLINTHKTMLFSTKYLLENSRDHLKLFNIPDRGKKKKTAMRKTTLKQVRRAFSPLYQCQPLPQVGTVWCQERSTWPRISPLRRKSKLGMHLTSLPLGIMPKKSSATSR